MSNSGEGVQMNEVAANRWVHGAGILFGGTEVLAIPSPIDAPLPSNAPIEVGPGPLQALQSGPDLLVAELFLSGGLDEDQGIITGRGAIVNAGDSTAAGSVLSVYLSQDATITGEDTRLGSLQIPSLTSGYLIDFEMLFALPEPPEENETYYIGVIADSGDAVLETDEENNASQAIAFSINTPTEGATVANIEPYILLARSASQIQTTADLVALGNAWRLGEALSRDDLASLVRDLEMAQIDNFDDVSLFQFQAMTALQSGNVDALLLYRDSTLIDPLPAGIVAFEIPNTPGDLLPFDPEVALITGTNADNYLRASAQSDLIVGGGGDDTVIYAGAQSNFTLTLTPSSLTLLDRRDATGLVDSFISIEALDFGTEVPVFGGRPMPLDLFTGPTQLTTAEFSQITELYIAYFNRAPDAIGLYYWGTEYERGFTLAQMASSFFEQAETRATYASVLDHNGNLTNTNAFVSAVYNNVLGRSPDSSGFAYWVNELKFNPNITPPNFILSIINGAKYPGNPTQQTAADQAYLSTKSDIGAYYSIICGLSDVAEARSVMSLFDGTTQGLEAAQDLTDLYLDAASDPVTGDFLFPLVGVIDNPFALI